VAKLTLAIFDFHDFIVFDIENFEAIEANVFDQRIKILHNQFLENRRINRIRNENIFFFDQNRARVKFDV
jgi:hypothetical protein